MKIETGGAFHESSKLRGEHEHLRKAQLAQDNERRFQECAEWQRFCGHGF
jgi:hypothetical protein